MNQQTFERHVHDCLIKACDMYDLPSLYPANVTVVYKPKGLAIGTASMRQGRCILTFSLEAIEKYAVDMVNDTIPHEVAHLVCFKRPDLGKNHDAGWKRVCRSLGGDDSRTHNLEVTPAKQKVTTRYVYIVDGVEREFGHKHHNLIQRVGAVGFTFSDLRRSESIVRRANFSHTVQYQRVGNKMVKVQQPAYQKAAHTASAPTTTPAVTSGKSKRELCIEIYKANANLTRGQVIQLFVSQVGTTPAGAGTHYQNIKNGSWS